MKTLFTTSATKISLSDSQIDSYAGQGHPRITIDNQTGDIWILLLDLIEKKCLEGSEIYDQDGGEFQYLKNDGEKVKGKYTLYAICADEDSTPVNIEFELSGFFTDAETLFIEEIEFDETLLK